MILSSLLCQCSFLLVANVGKLRDSPQDGYLDEKTRMALTSSVACLAPPPPYTSLPRSSHNIHLVDATYLILLL
jgi:hypothetical protein